MATIIDDPRFFSQKKSNNFLQQLCRSCLPKTTKRKLLLGSILGLIYSHPCLDSTEIDKINNILHLARNRKALNFPIYLSKFIFSDKEFEDYKKQIKTLIDNKNFNAAINLIVNIVPEYLKYNNTRIIKQDIDSLFTSLYD